MSIWKRIVRIFKSHNDRGHDVAALKEDLDGSYRAQLQLLQNVRRGVADVATSRKRVELQIAKLAQQRDELTEQARTAVNGGDDEAARKALTRKIAIEKSAGALEEQRSDIKADEDRLTDSSREIQSKIEAFRVRIDSLSARHTAASARAQINSAVTGISGQMGAVGAAMNETEKRTRQLEAQADAVDEMVAEGLIDDTTQSDPTAQFDRQFEALSQNGRVEGELEALKRQSPRQAEPSPDVPTLDGGRDGENSL